MMDRLKTVVDDPQKSVRILIVTRELALLRSVWSAAKVNPWQVETSEHAWEVLDRIQQAEDLRLLLLDTAYAERDSLHLLRWMGRVPREFPIVVICHSQDARTKDEAMRLGASQVITRPLRENELEASIRRALESFNRRAEIDAPIGIEDDFFLSVSPMMQKVRAQAELLAQADVPVLIVAEPGSGAVSVAHLIHRLSPNSENRFRRFNCATLAMQLSEKESGNHDSCLSGNLETTRTLLDLRQPGTIVLENIEAMPEAVQMKIGEFLNAREAGGSDKACTNMRIVAVANPGIEHAVTHQQFREDVYSQLSAFTIQIPPLRRRKDEIEVLLRYSMYKIANQFNRTPKSFSRETLDACLSYSWPGNIHELETFVKRYLFSEMNNESPRAEQITPHSSPIIPSDPVFAASETEPSTPSLRAIVQDLTYNAEKNAIAAALQKTHWNRKAAARLLRVSYRTLLYKIERYRMYDSAAVGSTTNLPSEKTYAKTTIQVARQE
jgi:DNA-binding NtrC family response regulator